MKKGTKGADCPVVTANEFASLLQVSMNTFAKLLKNGSIPEPMDLPTRERKWRKADVEKFFGCGN